jgi:hypothetical protein
MRRELFVLWGQGGTAGIRMSARIDSTGDDEVGGINDEEFAESSAVAAD